MVDVVDMKLNDVVKMIRGKRGTVGPLEGDSAQGAQAEHRQHHPRAESS